MSKDHDPENSIKGRIAETIIEELLLEIGLSTYRNGVENAFAKHNKRKLHGPLSADIFSRPDFIAIDDGGLVHYIEVKYRRKGKFDEKDHSHIARYHDETIIVLISPNSLMGCKKKDYPQLTLLANIAPFNKNKALVEKYVRFCKFFSC